LRRACTVPNHRGLRVIPIIRCRQPDAAGRHQPANIERVDRDIRLVAGINRRGQLR
jgi:hypothetical protein